MVRVYDLKQWAYCPRIVYFNYVMPLERVVSAKMEAGTAAEEALGRLEVRRSLRKYRLGEGQRHFRCWLTSEALGLTGRLDLLIESSEGFFPVDVKFTDGPPRANHKLQLAAYALLVEEQFNQFVKLGFIYRLPDESVFTVDVSKEIRETVRATTEAIKDTVMKERMPEPTKKRAKCMECEYQNYCADIW